jgi:hypothetical protein
MFTFSLSDISKIPGSKPKKDFFFVPNVMVEIYRKESKDSPKPGEKEVSGGGG